MIVKDAKGNELLEVIDVPEERAEKMYNPVNLVLCQDLVQIKMRSSAC